MPDKKLTDADIIKALEDALHRIKGANHLIVPKEGVENLCNGLENALDLINRQKAEIVTEQKYADCLNAEIERLKTLNSKLEAEVVGLKNHIQEGIDFAKQIPEMLALAKAEAYKEFAERLKEDISNHRLEMFMNGLKGTPRTKEITYECVEEYIDNLLKELVGEDND